MPRQGEDTDATRTDEPLESRAILLCRGGLSRLGSPDSKALCSALLFTQPDPFLPPCSNGHGLIVEESTSPSAYLTIPSLSPSTSMLQCSSSHAHIFDMLAQLLMHESTNVTNWGREYDLQSSGCSPKRKRQPIQISPPAPNDLLLFHVKGQYSSCVKHAAAPRAKSSSDPSRCLMDGSL